MKVYIQTRSNGIPHNHNFYSAYEDFSQMGFETVPFSKQSELKNSNKEDIIVGYVNNVRDRLYDFGIITPEIDYRKLYQNKMFVNDRKSVLRKFMKDNWIEQYIEIIEYFKIKLTSISICAILTITINNRLKPKCILFLKEGGSNERLLCSL